MPMIGFTMNPEPQKDIASLQNDENILHLAAVEYSAYMNDTLLSHHDVGPALIATGVRVSFSTHIDFSSSVVTIFINTTVPTGFVGVESQENQNLVSAAILSIFENKTQEICQVFDNFMKQAHVQGGVKHLYTFKMKIKN